MKIWLFYTLIPALIIAADRVSKFFVRQNMALGSQIPLIPGVFRLRHEVNSGAAFSLFANESGRSWLLIILSALIIIGIIYIIWTRKIDNCWAKIGLAFTLGGAVGNLADRIIFGVVTDFLDFYLINFAVFNVADIFITTGSVILIGYIISMSAKERKAKKTKAAEDAE